MEDRVTRHADVHKRQTTFVERNVDLVEASDRVDDGQVRDRGRAVVVAPRLRARVGR